MFSGNYQNIICDGDSQTTGARTYTSWPHHLFVELDNRTHKFWNVVSRATNGYRIKDLLNLIQKDNLDGFFQACILIGINDCKIGDFTEPDVFKTYYQRIIYTLRLKGVKYIFLGTIPPIWKIGGELPYGYESKGYRDMFNSGIEELVYKGIKILDPNTHLVELDIPPKCFVDAVHFSEEGNQEVARRFADKICSV